MIDNPAPTSGICDDHDDFQGEWFDSKGHKHGGVELAPPPPPPAPAPPVVSSDATAPAPPTAPSVPVVADPEPTPPSSGPQAVDLPEDVRTAVEAAITETMAPRVHKILHKTTFVLGRFLKDTSLGKRADVLHDLSCLRPAVKYYYDLLPENLRDKEDFYFDDYWSHFGERYFYVRHAKGKNTLITAGEMAMRNYEAGHLPECASNYDSPLARKLLCLCESLQELNCEQEQAAACFHLAAGKAVENIGLELTESKRAQAGAYLKMFVTDGILTLVKAGDRPPAKGQKRESTGPLRANTYTMPSAILPHYRED